jgi:nucleoside 2-deoxyribosyltransferase
MKIYLAGPEVFLRDAMAIGATKKALCEARGFHGLFPLDKDVVATPDVPLDSAIYRANLGLIRSADVGIFNLTPFRGVSADVGTVFELGLMSGLGKPCFGYSNVAADLIDRLHDAALLTHDAASGTWRDAADMFAEDFGNADNLMIDACLKDGGTPLIRPAVAPADVFRDLAGFSACLDALVAFRKRESLG